MKRKFIFVVILFTVFFQAFSQDPIFTNINQSLVYLNPSFAGSNGFIRNQAGYRNQWPNLSGTYFTYYNSFDAYIKPIKAGLAFNCLSDNQARGILRTDIFSLSYAQHFSLLDGKLKIIPSFQMGYFIKKLDIGRLNFGDPIDPRRGFVWSSFGTIPASKKSNIDFSSGLLINYEGFYFGAFVNHINQPDDGLYGVSPLPYRLNIHSSYNRKINESLLMNFSAQLYQQQNFAALKIQVSSLIKNHIIVSGGISSNDVLLLGLGYKHSLYSISLGYDVCYSKLSGNTAGSWELLTSFNLRNKENRKAITNFESW